MKKYLVFGFILFGLSGYNPVTAQGFNEIRKLAEEGDKIAQYELGLMYFQGKLTLKDYKQAVYWWRKSALQGYSNAQANLGTMYANGQGVLRNYKEAFIWFKQAAEGGSKSGQYNLALMYLTHIGIDDDLKTSRYVIAKYWCKKSYDNGYEEAHQLWEEYKLYNYIDLYAKYYTYTIEGVGEISVEKKDVTPLLESYPTAVFIETYYDKAR